MFGHKSIVLLGSLLFALAAINFYVEAQNNGPPGPQPPNPSPNPPNPNPNPPTPTPTPTPTSSNCTILTTKPVPELGKYVFKSCIVAQFAAYFTMAPGKYVEFNKGTVDTLNSSCENNSTNPNPKLVINFPCGVLAFNINHSKDSRTYVSDISGQYQLKDSNSDVTFSNDTARFYTSLSGHFYRCNSEQAVPFKDKGELMLSQFALEAYRDTSGTDFYQIPEYCLLDSPPVSDLVRIGVGVCLVALVAIVLIAYFIGRRRWSERSSYESV